MEAEIGKARAVLVKSVGDGDAATASAVYADNARLLAPAAELFTGRDEIQAYWHAGIALGLWAVDFDRLVLAAVAGQIVELGRYAFSVRDERAGELADRGTYLVLHRQAPDGSWRRTVDVFYPDRDGAACDRRRKTRRG